jgi:hypothetical protein
VYIRLGVRGGGVGGVREGDEAMSAITVRNLWHEPREGEAPRFYTYPAKCYFEHRDVRVYKNPAGSFDFVLGDATIMQRGGYKTAREVINECLDIGSLCSATVLAHIRNHKEANARPA